MPHDEIAFKQPTKAEYAAVLFCQLIIFGIGGFCFYKLATDVGGDLVVESAGVLQIGIAKAWQRVLIGLVNGIVRVLIWSRKANFTAQLVEPGKQLPLILFGKIGCGLLKRIIDDLVGIQRLQPSI